MMDPFDSLKSIQRRRFLKHSILGSMALSQLGVGERVAHAETIPSHFAPKAKRVIYLFQSGGPSQLELWDYKPKLKELHGTELPDSIRQGQRLTGMTSGQKSFPVVASKFNFAQAGSNGYWISELLPHTSKIIDRISIVRSMNTEAINHDPAITFMRLGLG